MKSLILSIFASLGLLLSSTACQNASSSKLKVAATSVPHAEILEQIKSDMKEKGIDLDVIIVEDYNTPNRVLNEGEVDANFFQHEPFLLSQEKEFGYQLEILAKVHIEPMGLYSKKIKSMSEIKDHAVIALPSDPTNQARALLLLERGGLIQLSKHNADASLLDITENPHHLKFLDLDSPLLARTLDDVDVAAITTNFALQAGLSPHKEALLIEDSQSPFVNIVVIRKGDEGRPELKLLKEQITSEKVRSYIESRYQGAVVPAF